jgi:glycosyltransferase involved in cell wall biosynthesis
VRLLVDATPMALQGYSKAGAYRYCLELLRHLPAELPEDWSLGLAFHFFRAHHLPRMREAVELTGVADHVLSRWHPKLVRALGVRAERVWGDHDLVHGPFDRVPPTRRAARVVTVHDLAFLRSPEGLPAAWVAELSATVPPAVRRAHRVITVSEFSRRDLIERLGADPERTRAILHGISPAMRPPRDREADLARLRERYGVEDGYLLQLGTLQPNKNVEGLCAAYQQLRAEGFPGQLVLAGGQGWLFDEMWSRIVARGHDAGVLRTGYLDEEDVPRLYGCCRAFALVSRLEGFGIPVAEAMACGAPVVAADACSLPEVAGGAALLVDPDDPDSIADGLRRAAADGPEREELVARGLSRARAFTWQRSAAEHVAVYRAALEEAAADR